MPEPVRIAMWSGPRNISTAMMRSWGNRPDTAVWDEPFYAYYLRETGIDHPGREEIISAYESDWRIVVDQLTGPSPDGAMVFYQRHMTHHLLPDIDRSRLRGMRHAYLIRDPHEVLISYAKVRSQPTVEDLGLPQQLEVFRTYGGPVADARDILSAPEAMLRVFCERLGVPFRDEMLSWPAGRRETDGIWGRYWYDSVWRSTEFAPYQARTTPVPDELHPILEACMPYYEELHEQRITVSEG